MKRSDGRMDKSHGIEEKPPPGLGLQPCQQSNLHTGVHFCPTPPHQRLGKGATLLLGRHRGY